MNNVPISVSDGWHFSSEKGFGVKKFGESLEVVYAYTKIFLVPNSNLVCFFPSIFIF